MVQLSRVASFSVVQRLRNKLANKRHSRRADPEPKPSNMVTTRSQAAAIQATAARIEAQTQTTMDESKCFICQDHKQNKSFTCIACRYQVCSTCALRNMKFSTYQNHTPCRGVLISYSCPQCRKPEDMYRSVDAVQSCGSNAPVSTRILHRAILWSDFKDKVFTSGSFYAPNIVWITPHYSCESFVKCAISAFDGRLEVSLFTETMFAEVGDARTTFTTNFMRACNDSHPCSTCDYLLKSEMFKGEDYGAQLHYDMWHGSEPNWRGCTLHITNKHGFDYCTSKVKYYYDCLHPSCGASARCGSCGARKVINQV